LRLFTAIFFAITIIVNSSFAATLIVSSTTFTGIGSIQAAVTASANGDTILFSPSTNGVTIKLTGSSSTSTLTIDKNISIIGNGTNNTILSGDNKYLIVSVIQNSRVYISGIKFTNGKTALAAGSQLLVIKNCEFSNDTSDVDAGAISFVGDSLYVHNCYIHDNITHGTSGGLYLVAALNSKPHIVSLQNCVISNNKMLSTIGQQGTGGIYTHMRTEIINCRIDSNSGYPYGGGIYANLLNPNDTLHIMGSGISYNDATMGGGIFITDAGAMVIDSSNINYNSAIFGGGISAECNLVIRNGCTINGNSLNNSFNLTGEGGAGILHAVNNLTIQNTTISNNYMLGNTGMGGGLNCYGDNIVSISKCTISANYANENGGGIALNYCNHLSLDAVTITKNVAHLSGGGIYTYGLQNMYYNTLHNCIIAKNFAHDTTYDLGSDHININNSIGYNLIGVGDSSLTGVTINDQIGTFQKPIDPKLLPLANNGGKNSTHAILCGPAFNKGDPADISYDQLSNPVFDSRRDIGAFERQDTCSNLSSESTKQHFDGISIYPNPASIVLTIETSQQGKHSFELADITGHLVYTKTNTQELKTQIDISAYPRGLYLLKTTIEGTNYVHKISLE
jgi:hypothetical protein